MNERAGQLSGSRRTFLKAAVAAGGAGALTTVTASPIDQVAAAETPPADTPEVKPRGYRETAHIRDYYRTLRE